MSIQLKAALITLLLVVLISGGIYFTSHSSSNTATDSRVGLYICSSESEYGEFGCYDSIELREDGMMVIKGIPFRGTVATKYWLENEFVMYENEQGGHTSSFEILKDGSIQVMSCNCKK